MEIESEEGVDCPLQGGFYLEYYSGHQGKFGHEFLELSVEMKPGMKFGVVRYKNNSHYRSDDTITKRLDISLSVVRVLVSMVKESEILLENDTKWPQKNRDGKQSLKIRLGRENKLLETCKFGSLQDVKKSDDPDGLRVFYFLVQHVKALLFSLISLHFKVKPTS
ncbi:Protein mago nashi homolog [Cyberlindnera jadinii]|uniref:Protein mago nashi homolog n=1 Tax=Cyberlindnera jadinii (strain ATCC 18201 / CBS 1600 / BCRC 20928 / JCM 3617 / NBRC 0987 / NRRL Y-1542) TaxID=983966 RepID=A0A0H5C4N2_CYBJN|nr:Protein mago nashi homolog [Cyberlindnera jadinii]